MKIGAYLTGAFGQSQALYDTRNAAKRGRGSPEQVTAQILADTQSMISRQKAAGLSFVIDPMFWVYHPLQPLAERVPLEHIKDPKYREMVQQALAEYFGIKEGPQENWFNNNVFFRRPIIGNLKTSAAGFTISYLHPELLLSSGEAMVILPSPFTAMALSMYRKKNGYELGAEEQKSAIADLAQLLKAEAISLANRGFKRIQFDEPAIAHRQSVGSLTENDLQLLSFAMQYCGAIDNATTMLNFYFGDVGPIISQLRELPVDGIHIDMTETKLGDVLRHRFDGKELALGLVDARSAHPENPQDLSEKLRRVADSSAPKALWLTPNTGTEYIGWSGGLEKIAILEQAIMEFEK